MPEFILEIDESRCQGHAMCFLLVPTLFEVDDDGRGVVVERLMSGDDEEQAKVAVQRCPERAIILERNEGSG